LTVSLSALRSKGAAFAAPVKAMCLPQRTHRRLQRRDPGWSDGRDRV